MSIQQTIDLAIEIGPQLVDATLDTLRLSSLSFVLGMVAGLVVCLLQISANPPFRRFATVYVEALRGTPALVQLFIVYFGLASLGLNLTAFQAAVLGLGLNAGAYLAEVFRAGILAIHSGQWEAAQSIGMRKSQTFAYIIFPQMIRIVLLPVANIGISLLRDSSIASIISTPDLMLRANDLSSEYYRPLEIYIIVGLIYFLMAFPLSYIVRVIERRSAQI